MDRAGLTDELKRRALEEGFDAVGVSEARALDRDGGRLQEWLARGRQAGMSWMARDPERRSDPRLLVPGCRSVVSLAMNYWPGDRSPQSVEGAALVARYARGRDYHKVLGRRLKRLALYRWLQPGPGWHAPCDVSDRPDCPGVEDGNGSGGMDLCGVDSLNPERMRRAAWRAVC